jgi:hypothetical protein
MHTKTLLNVTFLVLVCILLAAQIAHDNALEPSIEQRVVDKIEQSGKGVILGVAALGNDTSILAMKLLDEAESNRYYAPVFFTAEGIAFQRQLKKLGLAQEQLPAVVYFNQEGDEISRITKIRPNINAVYHPKMKHHDDAKNVDYMVTLSQVLSTL